MFVMFNVEWVVRSIYMCERMLVVVNVEWDDDVWLKFDECEMAFKGEFDSCDRCIEFGSDGDYPNSSRYSNS